MNTHISLKRICAALFAALVLLTQTACADYLEHNSLR